MSWLLLGPLALVIAAVWWARAARRRTGEAARTRCPDCGGDLRGYGRPFTCPHCFATLDDDEDDSDEPDSVDEVDEDYDEAQKW